MEINEEELRKIVGGTIFSIQFTKRSNGAARRMVCRLGVKKYLRGGAAAYNPTDKGLMTVYDLENKGYRSIPLDSITGPIKARKRVINE